MTLYENTTNKQIGESIKLKSDTNKTYVIDVNDFVEEFRIEYSEDPPYQPSINMEIVKY